MGQVAAALNVTPGTATTMVKALAESGLAEYEPYSGVRLTPAGEKLAGLVLRGHRLPAPVPRPGVGVGTDRPHPPSGGHPPPLFPPPHQHTVTTDPRPSHHLPSAHR